MRYILLILAIATQPLYAQSEFDIAFRIPEKDLIPEGIAYDPASGSFFLGSIHKSKILRISRQGRVSDFISSNAYGILNVLGMKVHGGNLWVCNNSPEHDSTRLVSNVHVFDLASGKLLRKYTIDDSTKHLFNDVVVTSGGDAFATDSDGGNVYKLAKGSDQAEPLLSRGDLRYPNGICLDPTEERLIVSTGSGLGVVTIEIDSAVVKPLLSEHYLLIGMDGLYRYGSSLIGVQNVTFPEAILRIQCDAAFTKVASVEPLLMHIKEFDVPTTGVLVDDHFYFIANSQLLQIIGNAGRIKNPADLRETLIMRVKLK